jgi:hypothetical protein
MSATCVQGRGGGPCTFWGRRTFGKETQDRGLKVRPLPDCRPKAGASQKPSLLSSTAIHVCTFGYSLSTQLCICAGTNQLWTIRSGSMLLFYFLLPGFAFFVVRGCRGARHLKHLVASRPAQPPAWPDQTRNSWDLGKWLSSFGDGMIGPSAAPSRSLIDNDDNHSYNLRLGGGERGVYLPLPLPPPPLSPYSSGERGCQGSGTVPKSVPCRASVHLGKIPEIIPQSQVLNSVVVCVRACADRSASSFFFYQL